MGVTMTNDAAWSQWARSLPLVKAADAFAASTVFGSIVAARGNIEGAPFGVNCQFPFGLDSWRAGGSGVSAPWSMATACVRRRHPGPPKIPAVRGHEKVRLVLGPAVSRSGLIGP